MAIDPRVDEKKITITLTRDEAIVLFVYFHRELYDVADEKNLRASFVHAAEVHGLLALHQCSGHHWWISTCQVPNGLKWTREHLLKRHRL